MHLFFSNALIALQQVTMLYLVVGMGFAAERLHWFPEAVARQCTKLLLYVITPCVIVRSFLTMEYSPAALRGLAVALLGGILLHVTGLLISEPLFRKGTGNESILHFASMYGNCGYMGLPLAQAMVGSEGVFYCSIVILTFQIFSFTHGEFVMAGGLIGRKTESNVRFDWKKLFLNAGVLSVSVGLPLFLLRVPVPELISQPISTVASMNSPLAMLMFGAYLSRTDFKTLLRGGKKIFAATGVKLLAIPAVVMGVLLLCGVRGPLLNALLISASAPSANNTVVFAARHGRDAGYAAQVVGLISILSIITMPLVIAVGLSL